MSKSIFISTVYEDSHRIEILKKWVASNLLGDVVITHETEDKRHLGKEAIKKHIENKIRGAAIIMIFIGQDTHNHDWIEAEVELANSFHIKLICLRLPQTTGAVPTLLSKRPIISFEPNAIKLAIYS